MPQAYVQALFDQYAPRFESALVDDLGYRGPALLFKAVLSVRAAAGKPAFFKRAIDLGCGTGLAATAFAREVDRFHRHRPVAAHDRAGARHRPLCGARSRRHGAGSARQAGCQRRSDSRRRRDGLCLRSRAGAARGRAGADAGRPARLHRRDPWRRGRHLGEGLRYAHGAALCAGASRLPGSSCRCWRICRRATRTTCRCRAWWWSPPNPEVSRDPRDSIRLALDEADRSLPAAREHPLLDCPHLVQMNALLPDRFRDVRRPRLVAARASARAARESPRRPLGAADRADRRRQDAGRISADAGGVDAICGRSSPLPPRAGRSTGEGPAREGVC